MRLTRSMNKRVTQRGAVSLFVVVFAALLLTVVTVSFLRMMVQDQQQASSRDLSQSAYDSAQAGVQDAQRAILRYIRGCELGDGTVCNQSLTAWAATCNASLTGLGVASTGEVPIQQNSEDAGLNQAYTCVKVRMNTDDYVGFLNTDGLGVVPLSGEMQFDTVQINWYTRDDLADPDTAVVAVNNTNPGSLTTQASWSKSKPSLLRTQLIQFGDRGFRLSDFDATGAGSNGNTLFLYPTTRPAQTAFFSDNNRVNRTVSPTNSNCRTSLSTGGYACSQRIVLPAAVDATTSQSRTAYLVLKPFYNATYFQVQLYNGPTLVRFQAVQPAIDSTGRANDLFRRVETRVNLVNDGFPFPDAAVDVGGSFCKNFGVTNNTAQYGSINTINTSQNSINGCRI